MDTTVAKGLSVIEVLAQSGAPMRLSAIAEQLNLQRSNVHRLLSTLAECGYVAKEPATGRYGLTLRLWELGSAVLAAHPVRCAVAPYIQELHRATSETVSLTVLEGSDVLYLDKILAPRVPRFTTRAGSRAPAGLVLPGKVLLAYEPDARACMEEAIQAGVHPLLDIGALMAELDSIHRNGYACGESNFTPGVFAVAAPIMRRDGGAAAALSVSGPRDRISSGRTGEIIEILLDACARITEHAALI